MVIEISCTRTQREKIVSALARMPGKTCIFPRAAAFCVLDKGSDCESCIRGRIKWNIKEAPGKARKKG